MKFFRKNKDGGPKSTVTGYWLAEIKSLFSIALLKFENGSRDAYHSHAFDSVNWVLRGRLAEEHLSGEFVDYVPSLRPVITRRDTFHRVISSGTSWVLSFRGPWTSTWQEYNPATDNYSTLAHGRTVVK